ncbi:MAG: putative Ig domain-containing protein [Candidatus Omnitrophica bacterium]|nr:putative Ig domain-containing protein [Candidatus Omnitrophota bacterium]
MKMRKILLLFFIIVILAMMDSALAGPPVGNGVALGAMTVYVNNPPVLNPIGSKSVNENDLLSFTISGSDPDGNTLTYSASGLPSGATFTASTKTFQWKPSYTQSQVTPYSVKFTVSDGALTASETIAITVNNVNRPPTLNAISNKGVAEGRTLKFTVAGSDPDGDAVTFSAGTLPPGATFDPATKTFQWTPAFGQGSVTPYNVTFIISDSSLTASQTVAISVSPFPTFKVRARVVSRGGAAPLAATSFTMTLNSAVKSVPKGSAWSDWLTFDTTQADKAMKAYPNSYLGRYPVVTTLNIRGTDAGTIDATVIDFEIKVDETGELDAGSTELFGYSPNLGINIWRDDNGNAKVATMADYNQVRYWDTLEGFTLDANLRPKNFPIIDRFIGGDDDKRDWREGMQHLANTGMNVFMAPPTKAVKNIMNDLGFTRYAWAIYCLTGYAFDSDSNVTPQKVDDQIKGIAKSFTDAGFSLRDMVSYVFCDEPGWYFPSMFTELANNPSGLTNFRNYLQQQGLSAADVGAASWDQVVPIGVSKAIDIPSKRLFYWTMRFFSWESTRYFIHSTASFEKWFYPGVSVSTNWNNFSSRFYNHTLGNNPDTTSPDRAMGSHDWFEFGRMRGATTLWTEDWFGDGSAFVWSYRAAKLRSSSQKSGGTFGGYIVPRSAGGRENGILQKILTLAGSGAKMIEYFVFGPEYVFPGNCYSDSSQMKSIMSKMAEAHGMIAASEDIFWPGKPAGSAVAILMPRSSMAWDNISTDYWDEGLAVNNYLGEVYNLYFALEHKSVLVDFVDEDDLTPAGLAKYKVLYVTEPDIPEEGQAGIKDWVKAGGTLAMVPQAGTKDRYHEPCSLLKNVTGMTELSQEVISSGKTGQGPMGSFAAYGNRGLLDAPVGMVTASFDDGKPAIVVTPVGSGRAIYYSWYPGYCYSRTYGKYAAVDGLYNPLSFSDIQRDYVSYPLTLAQVTPPVSISLPLIEAPMLIADQGALITVLNWRGAPQDNVTFTVRLPFTVQSVKSVKSGELTFTANGNEVSFSMPLGAADIVMFRPNKDAVLYGDVNGDGKVTAFDALLAAQYAVGIITLTTDKVMKADVSADGQVSAFDAVLIAKKAIGLIDKFPVETKL